MNQTEFADHVGMDRPVVNQYLSGERSLGEKNAKRFAAAMGEPEAWRELVTKKTAPHVRSLEARLLELEERAATLEDDNRDLARLVAGLTVRVERLEGGASQKQGGST